MVLAVSLTIYTKSIWCDSENGVSFNKPHERHDRSQTFIR